MSAAAGARESVFTAYKTPPRRISGIQPRKLLPIGPQNIKIKQPSQGMGGFNIAGERFYISGWRVNGKIRGISGAALLMFLMDNFEAFGVQRPFHDTQSFPETPQGQGKGLIFSGDIERQANQSAWIPV
jgi:hypothetical protein